jgi:hypothetical protein
MLAALFASIALADDFKTIDGKGYKDVTVSRVEPDGIVLKSKSGISKVYFVELPKEVQERFHYEPAKAAEFNAMMRRSLTRIGRKFSSNSALIQGTLRRKGRHGGRHSYREYNSTMSCSFTIGCISSRDGIRATLPLSASRSTVSQSGTGTICVRSRFRSTN